MKIKKIGHCCLVIEINGKRIMTDPGSYTISQHINESNIDVILVTHEHADHLHTDSLKKILENNSNAIVITNTAVGKILTDAGIKYQILEDGQAGEFNGVPIEAHGEKHAFIRSGISPIQNTGYYFGGLFYPGDAFTKPARVVDILALPVSAPWLKVEEVLNYAQEVKPRIVFPVHDGMLNEFGLSYVKKVIPEVLQTFGVEFKFLELGKEEEL